MMKRTFTLFLLLVLIGQGAMAQNKKEQIAALEHAVDSLTGRVETLDRQLSQRTDDYNRVIQKLAQCNDEKNQLAQELDKANQSVKQLQQKLNATVAEKDKQINELNQVINALREELSAASSELAEKPLNESEGFHPVHEFIITGHPKYAKAILSESDYDGEGNAAVDFYDQNGNLVESIIGDGGWAASGGFTGYFGNIEIGVMGMGAGPYFTENNKDYKVRLVNK